MTAPPPLPTGGPPAPITVEIRHAASVAHARGEARRLAQLLGWPATAAEELAICASELAQNIVSHAHSYGTVTIEACGPGPGIRLSAVDGGPGVDIRRAIETPPLFGGRQGLSALGRLMQVTQILVGSGSGTRVVGRKWPQRWGRLDARVVVVERPYHGGPVSGDVAVVETHGERLRLAVLDGLGHGEEAHRAAAAGVASMARLDDGSVEQALERAHQAMAQTRGAAATVVEVDFASALVRASGVGNVRAVVQDERGRHWSAATVDGILGFGRAGGGGQIRLRVEETSWPPESVIALFSDGVSSRLELPATAAMVRGDPVRVALGLFAQHAQLNDDATLVLATRAGVS